MSDILVNKVSYTVPETGRPVLQNINLSVESAETITIVGLSGAGKSTLLKIIAGLIEPTNGEVTVGNVNVSTANRKQVYKIKETTGFMFQNAALISNLNIYDNVALPLRYHHSELTEDEIFAKIKEWFDIMQIQGDMQSYPSELNINHRRLVGLIRAVVNSPKYVFLDEPTINVDFGHREVMKKVLAKLRSGKTTMVMASNNLKWVSDITDRFAVLDNGKIEFFGKYDNMFSGSSDKVKEILKHIGG